MQAVGRDRGEAGPSHSPIVRPEMNALMPGVQDKSHAATVNTIDKDT